MPPKRPPEVNDAELLEEMRVGRSATELLAEPLLAAFFDQVEAVIVGEWRKTRTNDAESQQHWRRMLECHNNYRATFRHFMVRGEVARRKLEEASRLRKLYDAATRRFR